RFSETDEIVELAKVIAPYGGIYHSHIRNEAAGILEALKEAIEIGERAGVPVHISHFKVVEKKNWGLSRQACALIEEARQRGLKITADQYPYRFTDGYPYYSFIPGGVWRGQTEVELISREDIVNVFGYLRDSELIDLYTKVTPYYPISERHQQFLDELPRKRLVNLISRTLVDLSGFSGVESLRDRMLFMQRMNDPEESARILEDVRRNIERVGAEEFIVGVCVDREFEGKSLQEIAAMKGKSVEETAIELDLMGAKAVPMSMSEDDIEYIMSKDYVGTGSDGLAPFYGLGLTHIRSYSTFLHKIKKYALEREAVSVEHVIRSQTSLPAQIMNWDDRGWIKEGYRADIVVIDLRHIETPTSISNPNQYSSGVKYLVINGELVIDDGNYTGARPGQVIRLKD
ncbi:MAG: amidohydrolase family protein, partial [candidate division NC10 bacterium]